MQELHPDKPSNDTTIASMEWMLKLKVDSSNRLAPTSKRPLQVGGGAKMVRWPRPRKPRRYALPDEFGGGALSERPLTRRSFLELLAAAGLLTTPLSPFGAAAKAAIAGFDNRAILTILGILQPAGTAAVHTFIRSALPELADELSPAYLEAAFKRHLDDKRIFQVRTTPHESFSLTAVGNASLPRNAQLLRDKARLFLMRGRAPTRLVASRGGGHSAAGVPPSSWVRARIEDFIRSPGSLGAWTFADRRSGKRPSLRDTLPRLLSFEDLAQVNAALGNTELTNPLSIEGLALCLGVSPALLTWFAAKPEKSYREFSIPKRSGGERPIESPRIFLKVTQRLLLEFFLADLKTHEAVYSFRAKRSSALNATRHQGQAFVGGLDIEDYFGSITPPLVTQCLIDNGFDADLARRLAALLTLRGFLPQGAPTSPMLSNAILFGFDERMHALALASGLTYTRYGDDMVFSGADQPAIEEAFRVAAGELRSRYGLRLNGGKTRLVPQSGRQVVTGAVVNKAAAPPRSLRRKVRAMFHQANREPARYANQVNRLRGYIGYLGTFESLKNSDELSRYRAILSRVRRT